MTNIFISNFFYYYSCVQWLNIFRLAGDSAVLEAAFDGKKEICRLEKLFNFAASEQLKFAIKKQIEKILLSENDNEKPFYSLNGLNVKIKKGYTCSQRWFLHFLQNMEPVIKRIVNNTTNNDESDTKYDELNTENDDSCTIDGKNLILSTNEMEINDIEETKKNDGNNSKNKIVAKQFSALPAIISKNIFLFEKNNENENEKIIKKYLDKFSFLQYLPLEIEIVGKI